MESNQGYEIERAMMKWFKGKTCFESYVDFQTTTSFYEVKSCRLLNKCNNGNDKRSYKKKPHKKIKTTQMGRFFINLINHKRLRFLSNKKNKIPKYIFVVLIGKQKIWRVKPWEEIDPMVHQKKKITAIRIKDLFHEFREDR